MKTFHLNSKIGKAKYDVAYQDRIKKHQDGSEFFDIAIFKNVKTLDTFINDLLDKDYIQTP